MSAIPLFFFQRTHFTILISNIVIISLPSYCTFYLFSSGLQPCRCYTSSTYLLNHVSRCLKASTIKMSLISPRNFISSVIEKAMQGTAVILKMLLQQLCHENNLCNVSLTLQHMLDDLKSLPFQEGGVSSFRYPTEKEAVHGKSIPGSLEVQEITYLHILKVCPGYQRKRERKKNVNITNI